MTDYLRIAASGRKKERAQAVIASSGTADGNRLAALDPTTGQFHPSVIPGSEEFGKAASEALAAGDFVNVFDDGGTEAVRKADASDFSTRATGFVTDNITSGSAAQVQGEGILGGLAGLTIGEPVFLDLTTPGGITQSPDLTNVGGTDIWQKVGDAISPTEIRIEIGEAICL